MATDLKIFAGQNRHELSMIEVAHALLEQRGEVADFSDLVNELQNYLGKSDLEIREKLSQFYTDLNTDGSFISLGDNRWGLRSWYAIDEIDEALINVEEVDEDEDEDSDRRKKRKKRVNAFVTTDDENAIDWNNDDVEDDDLDDDNDEDELEEEDDEDDEDEEIAAYDSDLKEVIVEEDEEAEKIDPKLIGADEEDLAEQEEEDELGDNLDDLDE